MYVLSFLCVCIALMLSSSAVDLEKNGPYKVPVSESHLCALSIDSDKDFQIDLVQIYPRKTISIFIAMTKYNSESQIVATGVGDTVAIVTRDKIDLRESHQQMISIFRKNNVLAMYRAGQIKPVLVYVYKGPEKIDFGNFEDVVHTGSRGYRSLGAPIISDNGATIKTMAEPHGEVIRKELHMIRREINRRLGIMDAYLKKIQIQQLPLDTLKTIEQIFQKYFSYQVSLLDYYGVELKRKYKAYKETIFKKKRPEIIARIKSLSK